MTAADDAILQVRVVPRAGRTELGGWFPSARQKTTQRASAEPRRSLVRLRTKRYGETSTKLEERSRSEGGREEVLVVRLAAAPVDGAANQALTDFLARVLDVPRRSVTIASGERSRHKRVRITGLSPEQLTARLSAGIDRLSRP